MKKLVIVLFLVFLFIQIVSAVEIQLNKEDYFPGETLQAEIYGNFIDGLSIKNIYFYREKNIPVLYNILKTKDKYLLYAILPIKEGSYSIKIKNARYATETGSSIQEIEKQFTITPSNETLLTVNPGFIVARDDFSVTAKANKNKEIEAEFEATGQKQSISLIENIEKKISFSIAGITNYTESNIKIENYNIPVFIFPEKSPGQIIEETGSFRFNPLEIKATILKNQDFSFKVSILNLGDINIENINFEHDLDDNLNVESSTESVALLEARGEQFVNLTFSSKKQKNYVGKIIAKSESQNVTAELAVNIDVTENKSEITYEIPGYTTSKDCSQIGQICNADENCDGSYEPTEEGYCCIGTCNKESDGGGSSWILGLLIILLVIGGLILLYYFMKKKQVKPEDFLKKREKKFEERMQPSEGKEVRGNLSRI